jgi:hypothetical protein
MTTYTITGEDTLTLDNRVFTDLADADNSTVTFPNNIVEMKTGKNKNTIYARNATGDNADMILRLIRGSSDDRFMQGKISSTQADFASTNLIAGEFVKRLGDGQGNIIRDVYTLAGGMIVKKVDGKENSDGDIEQGVAVYNLKFANAIRSAQ